MRTASATLLALALSAAPAAAEVRLSIDNGRVTLSAKNATVSQIMAEWSKVGQTRVVNAEKIAGNPVSLELANITEAEALDIILRSVSGYLLAPRRDDAPSGSRYDRIFIIPTSSPVRAAAAPPPAPAFPQPRFTPPNQPPDDNDPPDRPEPVNPPGRPPVFTTSPQPAERPVAAPPPTSATPAPTMPAGVAVPGMLPPAPATPNSPPR